MVVIHKYELRLGTNNINSNSHGKSKRECEREEENKEDIWVRRQMTCIYTLVYYTKNVYIIGANGIKSSTGAK